MMTKSRRSLVALLIAAAAPLFAAHLNADEQEKSQQGKLSAGDSATFVIDSAATADDEDAAAGLKAKSFVVIGKDGEKKVISSTGKSLSVTVNSSTSTEDNGDGPKTQVSGKMVIIGPDGEKKEYDLKDGFPDNIELPEGIELPPGIMLHMNEENDGESPMMLWRSIAGAQSGPRFMIGVMCEPAGEVLRSHLKLDGAGLVVESVSPDMPAVAAGIEKGDILLSAGDVKLKEVADLVKAVKDSEGKQIEFRVIKSGQESTVAVTPSQSTEKDVLNALGLGGDIKGMIDIDVEDFDIDVQGAANEAMMRGMLLRRFGPGIRLENEEAMKLDLFSSSVVGRVEVTPTNPGGGPGGIRTNNVNTTNVNSQIRLWILTEEQIASPPTTKREAMRIDNGGYVQPRFRAFTFRRNPGTYYVVASNESHYQSLTDTEPFEPGVDFSLFEVVVEEEFVPVSVRNTATPTRLPQITSP